MADIILKNSDGEDVTYENVDEVSFNTTTQGEKAVFVSENSVTNHVQSDWSQNDSTMPDYIKNKPEILSEGDIEYLTIGKENSENKISYIDDIFKDNVDNTHFPTTEAVFNFVSSYVKKLIKISPLSVFIPVAEWNGDTEGKNSMLGMFTKVSENVKVYESIKITASSKSEDGSIQTSDTDKDLIVDTVMTDLKEMFGITIYTLSDEPIAVIAERSGTLPAAVIEQIMGVNPGADMPYEAGTYSVGKQSSDKFIFLSKIDAVMTAKEYIDMKFAEQA